jgi:uncharacterized protein YycO
MSDNQRSTITPCQAIQVSPPGTCLPHLRPGDFILVHDKTWTAKAIQLGQSLRFRGDDAKYAQWNHVALVVSDAGDLIEATTNGVKQTNIRDYDKRTYIGVYVDAVQWDRQQMVNYAMACLGTRYGWSHIFSVGLSLGVSYFSGMKFSFGFDDSMICSGLVASCLMSSGAKFDRNISNIAPADLAKYYHDCLPQQTVQQPVQS